MMQKISFYPSVFNAEETNSLAQLVIKAIDSSKNNDEILLKAKAGLEASNNKLTGVLNSTLANPFTIPLNNADEKRDNTYVGGRNVIEGFTYWDFDVPKKEASKRLLEVIVRHGWGLQNYNYSKQSSATNSLINELKKPELQADLATIGLLTWYAEVIKSQEEFEVVFNQKAGAKNKKESIEKRDAQIPVNQEVEKLVTYLNSIMMFEKDNLAWNGLYNDIEGIIKQFTTTAKTRRSNHKPDNTNKPVDLNKPDDVS